MADGTLDQVLGWLRGTPTTKETVNLAPPLASYPSNDDAEYARKYGFSDGSVNQPYLDNQAARVLGHNESMQQSAPQFFGAGVKQPAKKQPVAPPTAMRESFVPESGVGRGLSDILGSIDNSGKNSTNQIVNPQEVPTLRGRLDNIMMRAGLAANRSPIAALGFDPSRVMIDSLIGGANIGGAYNKQHDSIYTNLSPNDSVVHESTHRGLQKLRELYPDQAAKAMGQLPNEEYVVRWLMHSLGGDPEGQGGPIDAQQRQTGIDMFGGGKGYPTTQQYKPALDQLQELAIDAMKNRGKRAGPQ